MPTALLDHLTRQIYALETANRSKGRRRVISTGCAALDVQLPQRGYEPGTIIEWLEAMPGCGGYALALAAARQAVVEGKYWFVVDRRRRFYPPGAQAMGLPLDRLIVVQPENQTDEAWAIDQALRCPAVGAVVAEVEQMSELQARRYQLAAEQGGSLGLWVRPARVRKQPSWAEIQWLVEPWQGVSLERPNACATARVSRASEVSGKGVCEKSSLEANPQRRIGIQALRMRGGKSGQRWTLAVDLHHGRIALEEPYAASSHLCLASELAMPTSARHAHSRACATTIRAAGA